MFANLWKLLKGNRDAPSVRARGTAGEDLAVRHLEQRGLRVRDRNWRCSIGEIDIVAQSGPTLVIVEVKSAGRESEYKPEDRVNHSKRTKLRRLAAVYLKARRLDLPVRYDVIAVVWDNGEPRITHYEDAFA